MNFTENIRQAINAVAMNKKRSVLTIIGIVVGLCAVITIVSIGNTVTYVFNEYFSQLIGSNTIMALEAGDYEYLITHDDIKKYLDEAPESVYDIALETVNYEGKAYIDNDYYSQIKMVGGTSGSKLIHGIVMEEGRFINRLDCDKKKAVVVISDIAAVNCFGSEKDAIGKELSIKGDFDDGKNKKSVFSNYIVVGVYKLIQGRQSVESEDDIREASTMCFSPYSFQNELVGADQDQMMLAEMDVVSKDKASLQDAKEYTEKFMASRFPDDPDEVHMVITSQEALTGMDSLFKVVTIVFVFIAAISLVVGGIGLMNTMLVTVTERTREIGIKKALGAKNSSIRSQFLAESAIICLIACIIGVFLSTLIGMIIESNLDSLISLIKDEGLRYSISNMEIHVTPSAGAVIVSTIFSIAVGLIFGYYPANKGAKMQPVDALRYE